MVKRLNWSQEAVEDLESIVHYIERDSTFYARAVARQIVIVAKKVPENPYIGRIVPELSCPEIRERFVYSYRLVYQIQAENVLIVAVIHGKRLLENVENRFIL